MIEEEFEPGYLYDPKFLPQPNPDPVEVLAFIPKLKQDNNYKTGWIVGWLYDGFFCTPGVSYLVDSVKEWTVLPKEQGK